MTKQKEEQNFNYAIGIDCGVNTGFAVWCINRQKLISVKSLKIHQAILKIIEAKKRGGEIKVYIEDARLRKWFGKDSQLKKQGAGSVKRDSKIWEDFCIDYEIPYQLVNPKDNKTKLDAKTFKTYTKFEGVTNEHSRDASMLVFGMK